ncbi:D-alanyl-D-alanine carboxypeptidase [Streptomyces neyagawaensis]|uniref:D-alanyl-D-alanine carboxypeptidase n=1 Tax=Streptomyces neyagawaensis TaxID=42238 RepID=UPI00201D0412|nr:D-alanyl-D-alanine carboxypeptidase [Streptomyces neyagawaensis]MCL6735001.1 D-alanyl-D-alanine carboxypeptidase [Streptomyces neyagawaensis]MDE1684699.1 D-alanyl-D-alanine carboxypeptidase [Streptomyces neyagawaensis]
MAGTSPDRSKRYESSTSSASGSEPPIPETPGSGSSTSSQDPRLSLSRPTSPAPSPKPDQATAVFSRRALLETAEGSEGAEQEGDADAEGVKSGGAGASAAAEGAESSDVEGAESTAAEGAKADDATGAKADDVAGAAADADGARADAEGAGSGAEGAGGTSGGAASEDAERGEADAVDGADDGEAGAAEAEAEVSAEPEDAVPDDVGEAESSDASRRSPGVATPTLALAARLPAAREAADVSGEADAGTSREAESEEAEGDQVTAGRAHAASDADSGTPRDRRPDAGDGDAGDADAEGDSSRDVGNGGAEGEGSGSGPVEDAKPEAVVAGDVTGAAGRGSAEADADPSRDGESGAAERDEADLHADADADANSGSGSGTPRDREPEPEPHAEAGDVDDAGPDEERAKGSEGGGKAGSGAPSPGADSDAAASGSGSGTPAPKGGSGVFFAKSRSSDIAAEDDVETEADAEPPVDQATAIFRAPKLPAVDQPTTMLKLGAAAPKATADETDDKAERDGKGTEEAKGTPDDATGAPSRDGAAGDGDDAPGRDAAPSERTSKFVALKSLDDAAPPKPAQPSVAPAEATRTVPQVGPERTTQQPLPPKPPLDLLAELTNTPPPPQTPLRTAVRRVKIWTPLVILLVIVFAVVQNFRSLPAPTLALTAKESYAFEGDKVTLPWPEQGQGWMDVNGIGTLDSFGEQKPVAIGSVAKAMTAYVILKEHPMKPGAKGATIPVDAKAETEGGYDKDGESTLNTVKEGDKLSQYDAIAAIMIPSANNIARLLARWDSNGSEAEFVKKMNAAAKDLGMKNTTYTDPSGLKETTVSTAEDQVKLGNELVRMKALTDITKLPYWYDPSGQRWDNYNRLVPYNNAIGIKTGSTSAAGGNLLFAGTKEVGGETAIVVGAILGQHTPPIIDTVNAVSKTAMIAAQDALTSDTILKKGDVVGYVDDQLGGQTPVVVTEDVSAVGWAGKTVKLGLEPAKTIPHQAKAGTKVGSLSVGDGTGYGVEVPVALQKDLTEPGFVPRLTRVS